MMRPLASALGAVLAACLVLPAAPGRAEPPKAPVAAPQDWKKEFEDVCAKTQDAMPLSLDELRSLVARCDRLKPRIEGLDESQRKVYGRRLQVCRDLYQFVVETREKG
jgi:hypothetical protein